ncbi:MAG TPA: aspartate dehydrogenase domain-containing protein [Sphingobacterium sp.]|nr:aspartate dehydrogenase domain-containing protein [Sphingobacterium sp.]
MEKKTLAIVGCGKLAALVVDAYNSNLLPEYKLVATYSRSKEKAQHIADKVNTIDSGSTCTPCASIQDVLAMKPDYIIETASPNALKEFALDALKNGSSIVTLSMGAFADQAFYEDVAKTAKKYGTKVHIASGAIGGLDVLRTASLMGKCEASFQTEKSPNSLRKYAIYEESLQHEKKKVFEGNAIEAIALFPTSVNVSVAASIASVGPENMQVSITSTPDFVGDNHRIEIKNEQVHAVVNVYSATAHIAGWSIVNTLRNIVSAIVF